MSQLEAKQRIYQVLGKIPAGHVCTYGQVAELAGLARAARLVGTTLKNLPKDSNLPWHRVINAQGRISLPPDSPSHQRQLERLQKEGVAVVGGRISLAQFQWQP